MNYTFHFNIKFIIYIRLFNIKFIFMGIDITYGCSLVL
jgi:hypothetical protein